MVQGTLICPQYTYPGDGAPAPAPPELQSGSHHNLFWALLPNKSTIKDTCYILGGVTDKNAAKFCPNLQYMGGKLKRIYEIKEIPGLTNYLDLSYYQFSRQ